MEATVVPRLTLPLPPPGQGMPIYLCPASLCTLCSHTPALLMLCEVKEWPKRDECAHSTSLPGPLPRALPDQWAGLTRPKVQLSKCVHTIFGTNDPPPNALLLNGV